jgi:ribosomal protein L4
MYHRLLTYMFRKPWRHGGNGNRRQGGVRVAPGRSAAALKGTSVEGGVSSGF